MKKEEALKQVIDKIKFPVYYDNDSQMILDQDGKLLVDIRGWGWIQKLTEAELSQDAFGERIKEFINTLQKP